MPTEFVGVSEEPSDAAREEELILITGLASSGEGVGRLVDGRVVFVEDAAVGDRVALAAIEDRGRYLRAKIGRLEEMSPHRIGPRCPHVGECGGCSWQHIDYASQLEAKATIVIDALERIARIDVPPGLALVPSPSPFGYRARARWVEAEGGIGYRVRGSRRPSPVEQCPVLVSSAQVALAEQVALRSAPTERPAGGRRRRREWVVTAGSAGEALVSDARPRSRRGGRDRREGAVQIDLLGESLRVSGRSFLQGNALLWEPLAEAVRTACIGAVQEVSAMRFVELYCGVGFFTIPLARRGATGVVLESDPDALRDLAGNLRHAELEDRVEVLSGRAEERRDLVDRLRRADVLLVDPPRAGLEARVRAAIGVARPPRVVYLSCNPATLARDLAELGSAGYQLSALQAFDLFPQTPHVETLAELTLASPAG